MLCLICAVPVDFLESWREQIHPTAALAIRESVPVGVLAANRLVLLAAVPLFLVLAVMAYITIQFAANERAAQSWVRHSYEVMEAERRLQDDIQTAEGGQRGYLITRQPVFFNGYHASAARAPADLKRLQSLTTDNPSQQARAARLKRLIEQRFAGLEAASRYGSALMTNTPPAVAQALDRARLQMTAVRAEVSAGLAEEQQLLDQRDAERAGRKRLRSVSPSGRRCWCWAFC